MILCLGPTPAAQRVMVFRQLILDAVNRAVTTLETASGKPVNVAKVLKALGESPLVTGFVGGERGNFIRAQLAAKKVKQAFVAVAAQTRECLTVIDEATGTHTELVEESQPVRAEDYDQLEGVVRQRIENSRALILSGSLTPNAPLDFYGRCLQLAGQAGILSVLDTQGGPLLAALAARPGVLKPNRAELATTVGRQLPDTRALISAMRELRERGAERVVVTAGREATLALDAARCWQIRPPTITAQNPIGSGDAFTAGLVWRLLRGDELGEACRWASACGAANALTLLPGEVDRADVERLVAHVQLDQLA